LLGSSTLSDKRARGKKRSLRPALFYPFAPKRDQIDASRCITDLNGTGTIRISTDNNLARLRAAATIHNTAL
jgi:hypothetical protein